MISISISISMSNVHVHTRIVTPTPNPVQQSRERKNTFVIDRFRPIYPSIRLRTYLPTYLLKADQTKREIYHHLHQQHYACTHATADANAADSHTGYIMSIFPTKGAGASAHDTLLILPSLPFHCPPLHYPLLPSHHITDPNTAAHTDHSSHTRPSSSPSSLSSSASSALSSRLPSTFLPRYH